MVKDALLVGIGGFIGSVLRHLISHAMVGAQWSVVMLGGVFARVAMLVCGSNYLHIVERNDLCVGGMAGWRRGE